MPLTITREQITEFAPKAKKAYVDALLANLEVLADAGILENKFRLCHFMGQVGAETQGMAAFRENMRYKPQRLRQVWPARFGKKSDAELAALAADPIKLADAVYGGRMGNKKGTADAYNFRGGGFLQCTGRANVESLCKDLGIVVTDDILNKPVETLQMACRYWEKNGCNEWADKNDILRVSKIVNTGSANSKVAVVGLEHRKEWLAKAMRIWGDAEPLAQVADVKAADLSSRTIDTATLIQRVAVGGAGISGAAGAHQANQPAVPPAPAINLPEIAENISTLDKIMDGIGSVSAFIFARPWVLWFIASVFLWWYGRKIVLWYLEDIRTGKRKPVFKVTKKIAEAMG